MPKKITVLEAVELINKNERERQDHFMNGLTKSYLKWAASAKNLFNKQEKRRQRWARATQSLLFPDRVLSVYYNVANVVIIFALGMAVALIFIAFAFLIWPVFMTALLYVAYLTFALLLLAVVAGVVLSWKESHGG